MMVSNIAKHEIMLSMPNTVIDCIRMSAKNISANKLRSFLTVLGILIGVASIITLISVVTVATDVISDSFSSLGAGTLTVSVEGNKKKGMINSDFIDLMELRNVENIAPSIALDVNVSRGQRYVEKIETVGKNAFFFQRNNIVIHGRRMNNLDEKKSLNVCWVSKKIVKQLFFGQDPLRMSLLINGMPFLVAGIFTAEYNESFANMIDEDTDIIIPYTTALKLGKKNYINTFTVYLSDGIQSKTMVKTLKSFLERIFPQRSDTITITDTSAFEDTTNRLVFMMSVLLVGIASIALLVGGIGIMNMMLTTVAERTAEIGLKKAIGAFSWSIQLQFLAEASILSLIGGVCGVIVGLGISYAICVIMGATFKISYEAILIGTGFSGLVGIVFGWAPAKNASELDPIEALHTM